MTDAIYPEPGSQLQVSSGQISGSVLHCEEATGLSAGSGAEAQVSAETQTAVTAEAAVQYEPPAADDAAAQRRQLLGPELAQFLRLAAPHCEHALQQNELVDVLADELAALADEDAAEGAGAASGAAGRSGSRPASGLVEHQSFSDLLHSKGKALVAVQWHPSRRGVVAVACAEQPQRLGSSVQAGSVGKEPRQVPPAGCILLWNTADAIRPEAMLQAPAEVLALAFHPTQPQWLAAGLATGQVALFNLQQQQQPGGAPLPGGVGSVASGEPAAGARLALLQPGSTQAGVGSSTASASSARDDGASRTAVLLPAFVSVPEASHHAPATDLHWLPGTVVSKDGRLEAAAPESGSGANAAPTCNLFATTAADGNVLLWDMRISTRLRRAAKDDDQPDWKPALSLSAASTSNLPLPSTCFCLDARCGPGSGRFLLGSLEGELVLADSSCYQQAHGALLPVQGSGDWAHHTAKQVSGHMGRVLSLSFSPFLEDTLLAVGDSGFVVWRLSSSGGGSGGGSREEAWLPLLESPLSEALYACGCWSPNKPGVVLLGRHDGKLEAWDLLDRTQQAAMVSSVAPCALTALAVMPPADPTSKAAAAAQLLAVGDASGTLHLLELPRPLRRRGHAELKGMSALLQREEERLQAAAQRAEARLAQQKAAEAQQREAEDAARKAQQQRQKQEAAAKPSAEGACEELDAEQRYLAFEARWRQRLGGAAAAPVASAAPVALSAA